MGVAGSLFFEECIRVGTKVQGSAEYVAIERVDGTLHGRRGIFLLQYSGAITRGEPRMSVSEAPDFGTGQLVELAGKMTIKIAGGKHFYEFEYTPAETP